MAQRSIEAGARLKRAAGAPSLDQSVITNVATGEDPAHVLMFEIHRVVIPLKQRPDDVQRAQRPNRGRQVMIRGY